MTDRHLPSDAPRDPIDDLRDLLEIEPSETFVARVRRSTAGQTTGRQSSGVWTGVASVGAVVAMLIVAWTGYDPVPVADIRTEAPRAPRLDAETGSSSGPDRYAEMASGVPGNSDARTTVAAVPPPNLPATTRRVGDDGGVIWTAGESVALERWVRDVQTRRVTFVPEPNEPVPEDVEAFPLLVIEPLKIAPLTIDTLQTRSPSEGNS